EPLDKGLAQAVEPLKHQMALVRLCCEEQHPVEQPVKTLAAVPPKRMLPDLYGKSRTTDRPGFRNEIGHADGLGQAVAGGRMKQRRTHPGLRHVRRSLRPEFLRVMNERNGQDSMLSPDDFSDGPTLLPGIFAYSQLEFALIECLAIGIARVLDQ